MPTDYVMTEKFEQIPAQPDVEKMYSSYELQELIDKTTGEERARAIERLKTILRKDIEGLTRSIAAPSTDPVWIENLKKEKEGVEKHLKDLESEN